MGALLAAALGLAQFSFEASDLCDRARSVMERGRHEESARILKTLIADYPDALVRLPEGRYLNSVVAALGTARSLPRPLEEALLVFAESEARALLPEVVPDEPCLLEQAAAYFPAPTAARALHLLAVLDFDRGRVALAARRWGRVRVDPHLASAAKSRLRLARWRPPAAPERMELAPKWEAEAGGASAVVAGRTLVVSGGSGLKAICLDSGEVLAQAGGAGPLCADGSTVFARRSSQLVAVEAGTLKKRWGRRFPQMISACSCCGRFFCVGRTPTGADLSCLDARAGKEQWKRAAGPGEVFCGGPRVFLMGDDGSLTAFDAASGRIVWALEGPEKDVGAPRRRRQAEKERRFSGGMCSGLVIRTGPGLRPAAFDPLDGAQVWASPEEGALFTGEACGLCILGGETASALDPASGETLWKARPRDVPESRLAGWKGVVTFLYDRRLVAYSAAAGDPVHVVGRPEGLGGRLLSADGGIIAVEAGRTSFLCDARAELIRLEALPRSASVSIRMAEILRLLGRAEEAFKRVDWIGEDALREERTRRRFVRGLVAVGEALGSKPKMATVALNKALGLAMADDERASCLLALARAGEAAGDPEEAVELCQRVIEDCPSPMLAYDELLSTRASVLAQRMIEQFCGKHGWGAYRKVEERAAGSALDARALYGRFPNSMVFCRRVAENPEDPALVAAALSSLRRREGEGAEELAKALRAALEGGDGRCYLAIEKAWFVGTQDSLFRPAGTPGPDAPVLTFDPRQGGVSAYDRVTGRSLWRASPPGRFLASVWAGDKVVCLCRGAMATAVETGESVTALEARWGRVAWSRRLPARFRPTGTRVLFSDGTYIVAGNEFGSTVYDAHGRRVRDIRGRAVGLQAGVALLMGHPPEGKGGGSLRAVELQSGATVLETRARASEVRFSKGLVVFRTGESLRCFDLRGGRPLWGIDAADQSLGELRDGLFVLKGPAGTRVFEAATGRPLLVRLDRPDEAASDPLSLFTAEGLPEQGSAPAGRGLAGQPAVARAGKSVSEGVQAGRWVVSGGRLVCILSGVGARLAGIPLGKGKRWLKKYPFPAASAGLSRAGRDAVLLWCATGRGGRGRAVLLDAATGGERSSCVLEGADGSPVRCAESLWSRVRGGIVGIELSPAPEDIRRLARKGGDEFFRRMAGLFRPGLARERLAELTRVLDMGRGRGGGGKKPCLRARKLQVKVDGDLGEWAKADWTKFSGLAHLWPDPLMSSNPPKAEHLSARTAVAWDEKGVYVAVEVTDEADRPGDAVEIHLLPRTGTRFRTIGKHVREPVRVRLRDAAGRRTRYEWGASWEALGVTEPKQKPGPRFASRRDFGPTRTRRFALVDIVVRDDGGWSLCLTGEALGAYHREGFAEVEFCE